MNPSNPISTNYSKFAQKAEASLVDGNNKKAARFYKLAADEAKQKGRFEDAAYWTSLALNFTADSQAEQRFGLLMSRAEYFGKVGNRDEQGRDLVSASTVAKAIHDDKLQARVAARLAEFKYDNGDYKDAQTISQLAMYLVCEPGAEQELIALYRINGRAFMRLGSFSQAADQIGKALSLAHKIENKPQVADGLRSMGVLFNEQGDYARATLYFQQAAELYNMMNNESGQAYVLNNLGNIAQAQGLLSEAIQYWDQAKVLFDKLGDRQGIARILINQGAGSMDVGFYGEARRYNEAALELTREINLQFGEALANLNLALIHNYESAPRTAEIHALAALELAETMESRPLEQYAHHALGHIMIQNESFEAAEDAFWQSVVIAEELELDSMIMDAYSGLAKVGFVRKNMPDAVEHAEKIVFLMDSGHSLDGVESRFEIFWTIYQVFEQVNHARTAEILEMATDQLQQHAETFQEEESRESFLTRVEANAGLMAALAAHPTVDV